MTPMRADTTNDSLLLDVVGVNKRFGGLQALSDVGMAITRGQIYGLIGPNGAGKTTFFNVITGLYTPDSGRFTLDGRPYQPTAVHTVAQAGIARTFQNIRLFGDMTALENVMVGRHVRTRSGIWGAVFKTRFERAEEQAIRTRSLELLDYVGIARYADFQARTLSYGDQRRLEIARALAAKPRFMLLDEPELMAHYKIPAEHSWMIAAKEAGIPVFSPGIEDSTLGNMFTARVMDGSVSNHQVLKSGTQQLEYLATWYRSVSKERGVGFFQIGGGIAGDFAICVVPLLLQDLNESETRRWGYFAQISDSETSYGGYSGAVPNEKITWNKLTAESPKFMIHSDATIVAPLIFAYVLGH